MKTGDIINLLGKTYRVELVNECRAKVRQIGKIPKEVNGKTVMVIPKPINISASTEVKIVRIPKR